MNTPVSFEIAKLLKEKGFDKKTDSAYVDITPFSENENDLVEYAFPQNHNEKEHRISAPTIAEVVMWLYEKHGIWINAWSDTNLELPEYKECVKWFYVLNCNLIDCYNNGVLTSSFNSPSEAYSQAIEYTLKNLI